MIFICLLHLVWSSLGPCMLPPWFRSFFNNWVIFHCRYIPCFLYSFIYQWTLGGFHVLTIVNSAAVNIEVHVSFWITVFSEYMPKSGITGSYDGSISSLLRNFHNCPPLWLHQFTFLPTVLEGSLFSTPFPCSFRSILWSSRIGTLSLTPRWWLGFCHLMRKRPASAFCLLRPWVWLTPRFSTTVFCLSKEHSPIAPVESPWWKLLYRIAPHHMCRPVNSMPWSACQTVLAPSASAKSPPS